MSSLSDDSLLLEFVTESKEHLFSIEPDLLRLEREGSGAGQEIINRVFRAIHSIKGAAGFFGLEALKNLSHIMESVLMLVRDGQLEPTPQVMDPLLQGVDKLNLMLEDISASETIPYQEEIGCLEAILEDPDGAHSIPAKQLKMEKAADVQFGFFQPDPLLLESAGKNGQRLFIVTLLTDQDLAQKNKTPLNVLDQLVSIGLVLDCALDIESFPDLSQCLEAGLMMRALCASVLEKDLVALALDIPEAQVQPVSPEEALSQSYSTMVETKMEIKKLSAESDVVSPMPLAIPEIKEEIKAEIKTTPPDTKTKQNVPSGESAETIRVRIDLLNKLMDLAGEMVLSRNQLLRALEQHAGQFNDSAVRNNTHVLTTIAQQINFNTSALQEHIMQTRMQPVGSIFGKFSRVVRDIARQLGKEIDLQTNGEDVELDKTILENLSDPLTHLIRNCCDHAIETPQERIQAGKTPTGTICLSAYHEGGQINISITDDGRGIDHVKVAQKALAQGIVSEADLKKMTIQEMVNLIFLPGLSTVDKLSDISGRGVGMDVVKTNIEKVGGHISIETAIGKGTTILLRLPLTLAIIPSLIVATCGQRFAVPQVNLTELVCVKASEIAVRIEKIGAASVLRLRGKLLPLVRLADVLELQRTIPDSRGLQPDRRMEIADTRFCNTSEEDSFQAPDAIAAVSGQRRHGNSDYNILVLKAGVNQFGLIVDEIFDMEEIVVKPLASFIKDCKCFSGATIMGDGKVAMILDTNGIFHYSKLSFSDIEAEETRKENQKTSLEEDEKQAILLFNYALDERIALPLSSILRLKKLNVEEVEHIGNRYFLTDNDKSIELLYLDHHMPVQPIPADLKDAFLIIPEAGEGKVGIVASRILDALEIHVALETSQFTHEAIIGSTIIHGHLTLFIDPGVLLEKMKITEREMIHVS